MALSRSSYRIALSLAMLVLLAGCPLNPIMHVSSQRVAFGPQSNTFSLLITNDGTGSFAWTIEEMTRDSASADWEPGDIEWLSLDRAAGDTTSETDTIRLTADRTGLGIGVHDNAALRITPTVGEPVLLEVTLRVDAALFVDPETVYVLPGQIDTQVHIENRGSQSIDWTAKFVDETQNPATVIDLPGDVIVEPETGTIAAGEIKSVNVKWSSQRTALTLQFDSLLGTPQTTFKFGAPLDGLELDPSDVLNLYLPSTTGSGASEPAPTQFIIRNIGAVNRSWQVAVEDLQNPTDPVPISISAASGSLAGGQQALLQLAITDTVNIVSGAGRYQLKVSSGDRFLPIPINILLANVPAIALSQPPEPTVSHPEIVPMSVLDFGTTEVQKEFWIANVGPLTSKLYFQVRDEDEDKLQRVVLSVSPREGNTNGSGNVFFHPELTNTMIDAQRVVVAIDRGAMSEDVETRTITVSAVDETGQPVAAVEPQEVTVQVARPPMTIEGAQLRSRPPYMLRFVYTLRDTQGLALDTWSPDIFSRIAFGITENSAPIDLNETNVFVTGPKTMRGNVALMLDFSGSMYYAGVDDAENPMAPGEALEGVRAAALRFIDDLPSGWKLALMYHNDRQQTSYLMQTFTSDRDTLKNVLTAFQVPVPLHGASNIYDAISEGVEQIAREDSPETLSFDDADVRALVLLTDGQDNASTIDASAAGKAASDNRVRVFPLVYSLGKVSQAGDLMQMAVDTGGHFFNVGEVSSLSKLLDNSQGLTLEEQSSTSGSVSVAINNASDATLTWSISGQSDYAWLANGISPAANATGIGPGGSDVVTITVAPDKLTAGVTNTAELLVNSNNGTGIIALAVTPAAGGGAPAITATLRDAPGQLWSDLTRQIMLTYVTTSQQSYKATLTATYQETDTSTISGSVDSGQGEFYGGDVRAAQLSLLTNGLEINDTEGEIDAAATVTLRCDYASRDLYRMRVRFFLQRPDAPGEGESAESAIQEAFNELAQSNPFEVGLSENGLLDQVTTAHGAWRLLPGMDGTYDVLTEQDNALAYGAFGNLLQIRITGAGPYVQACRAGGIQYPTLLLAMRVDNDIYLSPAVPGRPSETHYVWYPDGPLNLDNPLMIGKNPDLTGPALSILNLASVYDPEAQFAWDLDQDLLPDFLDPFPSNAVRPGALVTPNPLAMDGSSLSATLTVTNNGLDTFTFAVAPPVAPWISVSGVTPVGRTLQPGETGAINLVVDPDGGAQRLTPGFHTATVSFSTTLPEPRNQESVTVSFNMQEGE